MQDRFRSSFDRFFSKGGWAISTALLTCCVAVLLLLGGLRVLINLVAEGDLSHGGEHFWATWLQLMHLGGVDKAASSAWFNQAMGALASLLGLALIATWFAWVSALVKEKREDLKKGRGAVLEEDHTLILGLNVRTLEIIGELIEANASQPDAAIVVLSEEEKEEMDDLFHYALPDRASTRLITRSGPVSSPLFLKRMGVGQCRSVILLNTAQPADPPEVKIAADDKVLKTILAILAAAGDRPPPIIAQFFYARNRELALGISPKNILALDEEAILAKILAQTSRQPGLALVYSDLVGFMGHEVYFSTPPEWMQGKTFGEAAFHFQQSIPLGVRTLLGQLLLNPSPERPLQEGEQLLILAEDDSSIVYFAEPQAKPSALPPPGQRQNPVRPERFLVLGWSHKSPVLIQEYAGYVAQQSQIDVAVSKKTPEIQQEFQELRQAYPSIHMTLSEVDPLSSGGLRSLRPEEYDNVILLAGEGGGAEEADAETISFLLRFRQYFQRLEEASGLAVTTQLISEVMNYENVEIIQQTGVQDVLISNQFVSKIMAQLSEEPAVNQVYEELFRAEGSEIYLKPAWLYFAEAPLEVSFAEMVGAAQRRGEVCFGFRVQAEARSKEKNYGFYLLAKKGQKVCLTPEDRLLVLAEEES